MPDSLGIFSDLSPAPAYPFETNGLPMADDNGVPASRLVFETISNIFDLRSPLKREIFEEAHALQASLLGQKDTRGINHYEDMLALNDKDLPLNMGEKREFSITTAFNEDGIVGVSTYLIIGIPKYLRRDFGYSATIAADAIGTKVRGQRVGVHLMQARFTHAGRFLVSRGYTEAEATNVLVCNEFPDPLLLPVGAHVEARLKGEIPPTKRGIHWYNSGFRSFKFRYVDTETHDGAPPCFDNVSNALVGDRPTPIRSALLQFHFIIDASMYRKGGDDPLKDRDFRAMYDEIGMQEYHVPEDRRPLLAKLDKVMDEIFAGSISQSELAQPMGVVIETRHPGLLASLSHSNPG